MKSPTSVKAPNSVINVTKKDSVVDVGSDGSSSTVSCCDLDIEQYARRNTVTFRDEDGPIGHFKRFAKIVVAHIKQKVSNIVGLTALRLAFFMGYE